MKCRRCGDVLTYVGLSDHEPEAPAAICRSCQEAKKYNSHIIRNVAKCLKCGETIESFHGWDFKKCSCGNLAVDGGRNYIRRCFIDKSLIEELSEFS